MTEEFKTRLVEFAKLAVSRAERAGSEEATRQYLILPFLQLLGYDPLNPDEVVPESHASFSDKFKNRVDYAILKDGVAAIAIECKKVGEIKQANRGELKGYFNAVPTAKLGMLTDGLVYEMFTDTGAENMMDDEPFARLDLRHVADGRIDPAALDAIGRITKENFDPANVGADARRKLFLAQHIDSLDRLLTEPGDGLVRILVDMANVQGMKTAKVMSEHRPLVAEAVQTYMDRKILERVGFASRQDLVRTNAAPAVETPEATDVVPKKDPTSEILTTEQEMAVFNYVVKRLAFMVSDEALFAKIDALKWVDHKTVFCVYYKQERKGRIFNFYESRSGKHTFDFGEGEAVVETSSMGEIDEALLRVFMQRVGELG